jgi:hypothetical protein
MTLQSITSYSPLNTLFIGLLQTPGMEDFVTAFQTFAPTISSEIASYYADNTCTCQGKIVFYTELYNTQSAEFLYNYAVQHNIEPLVESLMVTSLDAGVILSGKVAKVKVSDWYAFAGKVVNTNFRSFSTSLSGDDVLVFFI